MFKKKKIVKTAPLQKRADYIFSRYIRLSNRIDGTDFVYCISCGLKLHWEYAENGHFFGRGDLSLRYDEENCNPQCHACNCTTDLNNRNYTIGIKLKYGENIIERLHAKRDRSFKIRNYEYEELIIYYTGRVKELDQTRY